MKIRTLASVMLIFAWSLILSAQENHDHGEDCNHGAEEVQSAEENVVEETAEEKSEVMAPAAAESAKTEAKTQKEKGAAPVFEGYVIDAAGNAVLDAIIEIPALGIKTRTDAKTGAVKLSIKKGTYLVNVNAAGFESFSEEMVFDDDSLMSGFEVMLEYETKEVVVTGTKTEKAVEDAPVKTTVITKKEIEKKHAVTVADALEKNTGVRVENNCQNCGFNQVRINGLDGHYSQVLIDGKSVFSTLAGVYGLEHLPVEMIDRIEIVKGGGSSLYGGSAIAGVLNVITRKPKKNFANLDLQGQYMFEDGEAVGGAKVTGNAAVVSKNKKASIFVFGGGNLRDPWNANPGDTYEADGATLNDDFSEIGKLRMGYGGANSYLTLFEGGELMVKFHVVRDSRRGGNKFDQAKHKADVTEGVDTDRWGGEVKWKHEITPFTSYELSYGLAYTERNSYYGGDDEKGDAYGQTKNPLHVFDATIDQQIDFLGTMILTGGFNFTDEKLKDYASDGVMGLDQDGDTPHYRNIGGLVQLDWYATDWMEIILGGRVDKHSEIDSAIFSPRATLMFNHKGFKSRSSFSTGFRAPQIFDEDMHIEVVGGNRQKIVNDSDLKEERSWNITQQFEYNGKITDTLSYKAGVAGYYSKISDSFYTEVEDNPDTPEEELVRRNHGETDVYGAEFEAGLDYKKLVEFKTGWTFEKSEISEEGDWGETEILRTPNVYGSISLFLYPIKGLEINNTLDLTGPMKIGHADAEGEPDEIRESDWFYQWDIDLAYKVDLDKDIYLKPYFGIKNILDSFQDDFDAGPSRDAGYIYGPRTPRTLIFGVKGGF